MPEPGQERRYARADGDHVLRELLATGQLQHASPRRSSAFAHPQQQVRQAGARCMVRRVVTSRPASGERTQQAGPASQGEFTRSSHGWRRPSRPRDGIPQHRVQSGVAGARLRLGRHLRSPHGV